MRSRIENKLALNAHIHRPVLPIKFPDIQSASAGHTQINTVVSHQIVRRLRHRMRREVIRRGGGSHPHRRADRHGNHVFIDRTAKPNACIKAIRDDIAKPMVGIKFHLNIRVIA